MTTKFEELMSDPEFRKNYAIEGAITNASQLICDLLERKNMKQADLARLLNKTPAYVSQLLSGKTNMTVKTLAEVAYVLGSTVDIQACGEEPCSEESTHGWDSEFVHAYRTRLPRAQHNSPYRLIRRNDALPTLEEGGISLRNEDVA